MAIDDRTNEALKDWESYREHELTRIRPILSELGIVLNRDQPHTSGERYLMRAVTTVHGRKLILLGKRVSDGTRVVVKATSDPKGVREIEHERLCRNVLRKINFAYQTFLSPKELIHMNMNGYTIFVQEFLEQTSSFLERPIEEQFSIALRAFKAQEGAHAAVYRHLRMIGRTFGRKDAEAYLKAYRGFQTNVTVSLPKRKDLDEMFNRGRMLLEKEGRAIEQYTGFLTHVDFVPHNFRVVGDDIYLLDHSSLTFGNKYEGWARFLNFMTLYNPELERALVQYVKDNRTEEESLSLKLMRVYRLGEILWYYVRALEMTSGNLRALEEKRVDFWAEVLRATLNDTPLSDYVRNAYIEARDTLRSEEEKKRQIGLH